MDQICQNCHARIAETAIAIACPACGGRLQPFPEAVADSGGATRQVDRRGIVLPARHAVGGIISPR